jgi:uncharacterized surface protein with fasciclin (FAS1) repeats
MIHSPIHSVLCKFRLSLVIFLTVSILLNSCKEEPQLWKVDSEQQVIGDYIASNPDQYSEFEKLIELAGMKSLLRIRGPFTVFLPTNEAMMNYYTLKGVSGLEGFSASVLENICRNHFIDNFIGTGDIGLGALKETNGLGDYLASEFEGSDIIISKSSKIIKRNIYCSNGVIHVLDKVLDPVTQDIFTIVSSDPSYSIFSEGLRRTLLMDTLQIISFPYGNRQARTRFTLLAVADTVYQRYGINRIEDLIQWCGANPDSITYLDNPFYRYMEYHCLNGSYYLSDLTTGVYPILSRDNNVAFTIDTDYKINYDSDSKEYTGFNIPASNIPAKNGALHSVDDLLPAIDPEPATVQFETTDFFDLQQGDYYQKYYMRFFDGENDLEKIKWRGNYLQYYFQQNNTSILSRDCLAIQGGWWEISITFPKVMKGKYEVHLFQPNWNDVTDCVVSLDGVPTPYTYTGNYGTGVGGLQKVADAVFETTTEHTITIRNIMAGMVFWDYVEFRPVK